MSPQFIRDRKRGEVAQRYVANMFRSWTLSVEETPRGYRPGFDLRITGTLHGQPVNNGIEVKYDIKASQSGNIYLDINSLKKSQASILAICLNDPIDTVLMLPLQQALDYALAHKNITGGEFREQSACIPKEQFISALKPKILTA